MMNLNNNQFFKKNKKLTLIFLVLTSVSIRIPIIFIFGDDNLQGEWRQLVNNLIAHGTLSWPPRGTSQAGSSTRGVSSGAWAVLPV